MMNTKIFFCGISVLVILAGCMIVNAVAPLFSETRYGQLPKPSITVNGQNTTGPMINMGVVTGDQFTVAYDVVNTGNVPITVNVSVVATGCVASLNASSTTLAVGKSAQFVLTLNAFTGDWQYTITFDKASPL
jgi:hypothetical protein